MNKTRIGIDRFIAKRWADYALGLRISATKEQDNYKQLQLWLASEIRGKEVLEKTASQLKRLWLVDDEFSPLRDYAAQIVRHHQIPSNVVLHYGIAINVFPFFHDLCGTIGRLIQLQGKCQSHEVSQRLLEKYGTPTTIDRATSRGLQTLVDWGLLAVVDRYFVFRPIEIDYADWFVQSILFSSPRKEVNLADITQSPDALGITFPDVRSTVRQSKNLFIRRNGQNEEIIVHRDADSL